MIDCILSCPNGYNASLAELASHGFTDVLKLDDEGNVTGISDKFNPLYPSHDDFNEPSLVYLRAEMKDITLLLVEEWEQTNVLAVCDSGADVMAFLKDDADALAEYLTYPVTQVPEFNAAGEPNIMFPELNTVEIEGESVQVKNPHYQVCLALGNFA